MKKLCFLLALCLLLAGCGKPQPPKSPDCSAGHTDQNNDDLCDVCSQLMLVRFDIYAVNDLHGRLADTDFQPGVDELSTYLKQAQQSGNTILLSTGDMWQGTAEARLTGGFLITEWMNEMGFAAMTLGGHEYDWGEEQIRKNKELAQFPFLGINVYSRETDTRVDYCQSSLVIEQNGVQVGMIGAMGDCQAPEGVYFKTGSELTALVKAEAEKLRKEGADFIIYTIHDGYDQTTTDTQALAVTQQDIASYYDTTLSDGYVDLVFEADSHYWYLLTDQHGISHLQAGGNNQGISHVTVMINQANGNFTLLTTELVSTGKYSYMEKDPMVDRLMEKYADEIAPAQTVLGTNNQYRNNKALGQLVANLYCQAGMEKWGQEYDLVLGGGYIFCRSPGFMNAGPVTYGDLYSLLPFDNQIMLCSIQGKDLISRFLENDHYAYHIKTTEYGEGIREQIDPDGTYYVVTDSYSANYAYNHMTVIDVYHDTVFARDLLAAHIAAGEMQ